MKLSKKQTDVLNHAVNHGRVDSDSVAGATAGSLVKRGLLKRSFEYDGRYGERMVYTLTAEGERFCKSIDSNGG